MAYSIDKIKRILEKQYDMSIIQIQKSKESSDGNVYIVKEKYAKFVLKIYKNKQQAVRMVKLYDYLDTNGIDAPHIIKNKSNESICCLKDNKYFDIDLKKIYCYYIIKCL